MPLVSHGDRRRVNGAAIRELYNLTAANATATRDGQMIVVGGVSEFQASAADVAQVGFNMYATVYDDDPTAAIIAVGAPLYQYLDHLLTVSPDIYISTTDHLGKTVTHGSSACTRDDAVQVLSRSTHVTPLNVWSIDVGQCPSFTETYITQASKRGVVWVYVGIVVVVAALAMGALLITAYVNEKEVKLRIAVATHTESNRAHRWIIGYGTDTTLGNPVGKVCVRCCCYVW